MRYQALSEKILDRAFLSVEKEEILKGERRGMEKVIITVFNRQ